MTSNIIFTGRRKTAVARVRISEGKGHFIINGKRIEKFIPREDQRIEIFKVLKDTNLEGKLNIIAKVHGGGITGQTHAIRLGLARALMEKFPELKPILKTKGYLTRDPREKERRKYGRAKARKSYQFSKR